MKIRKTNLLLITVLLSGCAISSQPSAEFYQDRQLAYNRAMHYHQHHPNQPYGLAMTIGGNAVSAYKHIDATRFDIANYIVTHEPSIPYSVALTAGEWLEGLGQGWALDDLAIDEAISECIAAGLEGRPLVN